MSLRQAIRRFRSAPCLKLGRGERQIWLPFASYLLDYSGARVTLTACCGPFTCTVLVLILQHSCFVVLFIVIITGRKSYLIYLRSTCLQVFAYNSAVSWCWPSSLLHRRSPTPTLLLVEQTTFGRRDVAVLDTGRRAPLMSSTRWSSMLVVRAAVCGSTGGRTTAGGRWLPVSSR